LLAGFDEDELASGRTGRLSAATGIEQMPGWLCCLMLIAPAVASCGNDERRPELGPCLIDCQRARHPPSVMVDVWLLYAVSITR